MSSYVDRCKAWTWPLSRCQCSFLPPNPISQCRICQSRFTPSLLWIWHTDLPHNVHTVVCRGCFWLTTDRIPTTMPVLLPSATLTLSQCRVYPLMAF